MALSNRIGIFAGLAIATIATASTTAKVKPKLVDKMHSQLALATQVRDAVIHGDLDGVHSAAAELETLQIKNSLPDAWRPMLAETKAAAANLATAPDLETASLLVGDMALSCAACHAMTGGGPKLVDLPFQEWTEASKMPLHKWSADLMWLGLLADDAGAFRRGGEELVRADLPARFTDDTPGESFTQLEQLVTVIGAMASEDELDPAKRAELYGQFIGVCTQCPVKMQEAGRKAPVQP
jgi:cytochrome c553